MKKDDLTLKDQVSVHLALFGGFQIPCKEYFALAGNVVMSTICEVLLFVTVVAIIVRWARMRKNLLEPFEETMWKSPLYTALTSLCVLVLESSPLFYGIAVLLAAYTLYLLFRTIQNLHGKKSL